MLIAVPALRVSCVVGIDKGRAWSVVEEVVLWACNRRPWSIADLAAAANLPRQVVVAALARLMRFRLVEVAVEGERTAFQTSRYGRDVASNSLVLPFFPRQERRRTGFVVELATGGFFPSGQVRIASAAKLANDPDSDKRTVDVTGGTPPTTQEAHFARLAEVAARGWDEQLAYVDGHTATVRNEYMLVRVVDGVHRDIPEGASDAFRAVVRKVAAKPAGTARVTMPYAGPGQAAGATAAAHPCEFLAEDLVVGGSAQRAKLIQIIGDAQTRVIVHSTFLDHEKFRALVPEIRAACVRGVTFDLLWGSEPRDADEPTEDRNARGAVAIAATVAADPDLKGRFTVHLRTTGSHAKLLLADDARGSWIGAVGSCNWLSTPFGAVEMTVILRSPRAVADVAVALQRMGDRRGLADRIPNEMALLARHLRKQPAHSGSATVTLVTAGEHASLMRRASGMVSHRMIAGTNRLGSTARPGMIIPAEAAVERAGIDVELLYAMPTGPLKKRHARELAVEAAGNGIRLARLDKPPLHAKFVAWDSDDVVVTSLNWGSATGDGDYAQADLGIHVHAPGIAEHVVAELTRIFPTLSGRTKPVDGVDPTTGL